MWKEINWFKIPFDAQNDDEKKERYFIFLTSDDRQL